MLQFIDYEVRADLSTSYNVERKRCVADDQDITRTRSTFWMKKKWKNINSSRRSTELLENWWVKMEKRGSHWCVCVDSKNCKIYIDRWRPLWVLCYCKTLAGNLPMLITVCTFFAAWWSLFVSYLQLLSFIWLQYETRNTSCYGYWYRAFLAHWPVRLILNMTLLDSAVVDSVGEWCVHNLIWCSVPMVGVLWSVPHSVIDRCG